MRASPLPGAPPLPSHPSRPCSEVMDETCTDSPSSHAEVTHGLAWLSLCPLLPCAHCSFQHVSWTRSRLPCPSATPAGKPGQTHAAAPNASVCMSWSSGHHVSFNLIICGVEHLRTLLVLTMGIKISRNMTCLAQSHGAGHSWDRDHRLRHLIHPGLVGVARG